MGISEGRLKKRAVSPVIATVILVAVAITVSVAVAYWMGAISTNYISQETTIREEAKISCLTYGFESGDPENIIVLRIVNTGTVTFNITGIFVNGLEKDFSGQNVIESEKESILIIYNIGWVSQEEYHTAIETDNEMVFMKDTVAP